MQQQPRLGCAAAIVRDSQLRLVKRLRQAKAGCWGLPGGKVGWLAPVEQAVPLATRVAGRALVQVTAAEQ